MQNKIAIILVNYNGIQDTLDCVKSIMDSTYDNFLVYVVNNGSDDDCSMLTKYKKIEFIAFFNSLFRNWHIAECLQKF